MAHYDLPRKKCRLHQCDPLKQSEIPTDGSLLLVTFLPDVEFLQYIGGKKSLQEGIACAPH